MKFPTLDEVEQADLEQLARWWRFLPPITEKQRTVMDVLVRRFRDLGGWTPELSKRVGWTPPIKEEKE